MRPDHSSGGGNPAQDLRQCPAYSRKPCPRSGATEPRIQQPGGKFRSPIPSHRLCTSDEIVVSAADIGSPSTSMHGIPPPATLRAASTVQLIECRIRKALPSPVSPRKRAGRHGQPRTRAPPRSRGPKDEGRTTLSPTVRSIEEPCIVWRCDGADRLQRASRRPWTWETGFWYCARWDSGLRQLWRCLERAGWLAGTCCESGCGGRGRRGVAQPNGADAPWTRCARRIGWIGLDWAD